MKTYKLKAKAKCSACGEPLDKGERVVTFEMKQNPYRDIFLCECCCQWVAVMKNVIGERV